MGCNVLPIRVTPHLECCSQAVKGPSLCTIQNWKFQQASNILTQENKPWSASYMFIFSTDLITIIMQTDFRKKHGSSLYNYETFSRHPDRAKYFTKNCKNCCCALKTPMGTFKSCRLCNKLDKSYYFDAPFMGIMFSGLSVRPASG